MTSAPPRARIDTVVIGAGCNGLVAAIGLARAGSKVLVAEASPVLGGVLGEIEFAPGFRAAPLAHDLGWIPRDVVVGAGLRLGPRVRSDPSLIGLHDGEPLSLRPGSAETAAALRRFSGRDAERWPAFVEQVRSITGFLGRLYRIPPPRIDADSLAEFVSLARLGQSLRGLGKHEMIEVLRTVPLSAAEWLDDWFESDRLKGLLGGLAIADVGHGPMAGGTAFTFLHRHVGGEAGVFGERVRLAGGSRWLIGQLEDRARAAGVEFALDRRVDGVVIRNDRVAGVRFASGEERECGEVVSSLDPRRTLLELLDPVHLDPEFIHAVTNIRYRGVTTKVLVALDSIPLIPGCPEYRGGAITIAPSLRHLERAADAAKYGQISTEPYLEIRFPSLDQPDLAPPGRQVAVIHVQYTPYRLREGSWEARGSEVGAAAIDRVNRHLPGFADRVLHHLVLTPTDLERRFGLREGAVSQGEMLLDQILFMRPVAGWARYATPMPGLFLCGSGSHPGGGITGMSGWLAAQAVLAARSTG
jgi:phytoene dehydrogenase-like protein